MHAQQIIQDLLITECPSIHAKRRTCVAAMAQAGSDGGLSLVGMSRVVGGTTSLRHRIKRCNRLLGNSKLTNEPQRIYGAMARRVISGMAQPIIIINWSDCSQQPGILSFGVDQEKGAGPAPHDGAWQGRQEPAQFEASPSTWSLGCWLFHRNCQP